MCNEQGHGPGRRHGHGCGPKSLMDCMPFMGHGPIPFKGKFLEHVKKFCQC